MANTDGMSSFSCGTISDGMNSRTRFPSPYVDYTSTYVWDSLTELFDWAEFSYLMTPEMREAMRRLVSPFVTPVKYESLDPDHRPISPEEQRTWKDLVDKKLSWPLHAYATLLNVMFYGNDFVSLVSPLERWLTCPDCGRSQRLADMSPKDNVSYKSGTFYASCKSAFCRQRRLGSPKPHDHRDDRSTDVGNYKIKHWPARQIVMRYYEVTEETEIYWNIPSTIKNAVKKNDVRTLATLEMPMLSSIEKNTLFKFHKDRIFHAKEPTLASIKNNGWGLPRVTGLHKQSWLLHLLRKSIQSIALDLDHPIKVVSPAEAPVANRSTSPLSAMPVSEFSRNFNRIINSHRQDPTRWHSVATPINAQMLGGDANNLFPAQMFAMTKEDLVDAAGLPIELYKGSLTANASPMGLRLFEVQNGALVTILNSLIQFVADRVSQLSSMAPISASHEPIKLVDDMQILSLLTQLASTGQISMSEPLKRLGISVRDDLWSQFEEQKLRQQFQERAQEITQKQQESSAMYEQLQAPPMDPAAQGQQPAGDPAAMPAGPLPGSLPSNGFIPPSNLMDFEASAQALAQQLVMMPPAQKDQELKILRDKYRTFHAVVLKAMQQVRDQAATQGRQQMGVM